MRLNKIHWDITLIFQLFCLIIIESILYEQLTCTFYMRGYHVHIFHAWPFQNWLQEILCWFIFHSAFKENMTVESDLKGFRFFHLHFCFFIFCLFLYVLLGYFVIIQRDEFQNIVYKNTQTQELIHHKTTKWLRLEKMSGVQLVQPTCSSRDT